MRDFPSYRFIIEMHLTGSKPAEARTCLLELYKLKTDYLKMIVKFIAGLCTAMIAGAWAASASQPDKSLHPGLLIIFPALFLMGYYYYEKSTKAPQEIIMSWKLYRQLSKAPRILFQ